MYLKKISLSSNYITPSALHLKTFQVEKNYIDINLRCKHKYHETAFNIFMLNVVLCLQNEHQI